MSHIHGCVRFETHFVCNRWINPGRQFGINPSSSAPYTLNSKIIIAMLISINEGGETRRRTLISTGSDSITTAHPIMTRQRHTKRLVSGESHEIKERAQGDKSSDSPLSMTSVIGFQINPSHQLMTVSTRTHVDSYKLLDMRTNTYKHTNCVVLANVAFCV